MKKAIFGALGILVVAAAAVLADNPHTPRAPIVVAEQNALNQTSSFPLTALFTPTSNGTFRLSVYAESSLCSGLNGTGVTLGANWTDDFQGMQFFLPFGLGCASAGNNPMFAQNSVVVHAVAGQPISVQAVVTPGASLTYSAYFVLEEL